MNKMGTTPLDQYQAAALIGMSPELLRYLTRYPVKKNDGRKLALAKVEGDVLYFDEQALRDYDAWLRAPWPAPAKTRPHLPKAIREEIRIEANLECALCKSSGEAGEAAHIEPVSAGRSNHPHNLIWLCANHHTKFDNGCFGPKGADSELVAALKQGLHHFKKTAWLGQAEVSKQIAATLSLCSAMQKQLARVKQGLEVSAVERIAEQALELLPKLATQHSSPTVKPTLARLSSELTAAAKTKKASRMKARLKAAVSFETEFLQKSGLIRCPLCIGSKTHNGYDCPVCCGDGAIDKELQVDLSEFQTVKCTLCDGSGRHESGDCPACGGMGEIERRFFERIDFQQYETVGCPLCHGDGRWEDNECPACHGERAMERRIADQINLADFEDVDCPLCKGEGQYGHRDCPECSGHRTMPKHYAERVDLGKYKEKECPVCSGDGLYGDMECPACAGGGVMTAGAAEQLDVSQYDWVNCPVCEGMGVVDGNDCPTCAGNRKIPRFYAERLE